MISETKNESFKSHQFKMFQQMQEFLTTPKCRRQLLLKHFEEDEEATTSSTRTGPGAARSSREEETHEFRPNCCDNCTTRLQTNKTTVDQKLDVTKDALRVRF